MKKRIKKKNSEKLKFYVEVCLWPNLKWEEVITHPKNGGAHPYTTYIQLAKKTKIYKTDFKIETKILKKF